MSKIIKKCAIVLAIILVASLVLVGCESFKWKKITGYDSSAVVESNGGYTVKQGNHLYFVNGQESFDDITKVSQNYFGNAEKGSIMRATIGEDGSLSDYVIVVPKKVMSTYEASGIFIYGNWIYYPTASTASDNNGNVLVNYIDYMRTRLDGQKTQLIASLDGQSLPHKFTPDGFVWYDSTERKIQSITYTEKKVGKQITVAENVASYVFPTRESYNGEGKLSDYFFYTTMGESDRIVDAKLFAGNAKGETKEILNSTTYTADPFEDKLKNFDFKVLNTREYDGGIELYYEKTQYATGSAVSDGVYGAKFTSAEFAFDKNNEKRFTLTTATAFTPISFEEGLLLTDTAEVKIANGYNASTGEAILQNLSGADSFTAAIKVLKIANVKVGENSYPYLYYIDGGKIARLPLEGIERNAEVMTDSTFLTGWVQSVDFIGEYIYYIKSDYNYLHRISLNAKHLPDARDEDDKLKDYLVGKMNEKDQKAFDEANEAKNK